MEMWCRFCSNQRSEEVPEIAAGVTVAQRSENEALPGIGAVAVGNLERETEHVGHRPLPVPEEAEERGGKGDPGGARHTAQAPRVVQRKAKRDAVVRV